MDWIEAQVIVPQEGVGVVEEALVAAGACAITVTDASEGLSLEPLTAWPRTRVAGLFAADALPSGLGDYLSQVTGQDLTVTQALLPRTDWAQAWKAQFSAFPIGDRLWVRPSWAAAQCPDHRIEVILDPGMAFGTGQHPTTRLCLQWLEERIEPSLAPAVLDYGCGSGILAVAAVKLGAAYVLAVDNDPAALAATQANAQANGVGEQVHTLAAQESRAGWEPFPRVVANILSRTLIELAGELTSATAPEGELALAGMLGPQADRVRKAFPAIQWQEGSWEGEWVRLDGSPRRA